MTKLLIIKKVIGIAGVYQAIGIFRVILILIFSFGFLREIFGQTICKSLWGYL